MQFLVAVDLDGFEREPALLDRRGEQALELGIRIRDARVGDAEHRRAQDCLVARQDRMCGLRTRIDHERPGPALRARSLEESGANAGARALHERPFPLVEELIAAKKGGREGPLTGFVGDG
jgi:hypothetical protein